MKKYLAILGMITCMVGLTACGQETIETPLFNEAEVIDLSTEFVDMLNQEYVQGKTEKDLRDDPVVAAAFKSWANAQAEMGSYVGILEATADITAEEAVVSIVVDGTDHDATVEMIFDDNMEVSSASTTVIKTFGEMMTNAALNTLIGMSTVFIVLFVISILISSFRCISKIQDKLAKKKENVSEQAVDHAVAQIIEKEEQADDLEVVAAIAAAIAASEGAASTDGFVVRSIRRRF